MSASRLLARARDYAVLTKPGITAMVLGSCFAGFAVAGPLRGGLLFRTLLGTLLASSGAAALNMWLEVEVDARMRRTAHRPLPSGRLEPRSALAFASGLVAGGLAILALGVGTTPALVAAATVGIYAGLYTPLKRTSAWNTIVGAIAGALPPLIGAAAQGRWVAAAWTLFLVLFLWQMPHFYALAWLYRGDYERAGLRMLPVTDRSGLKTGRQAAGFAALLVPASLLPLLAPASPGPLYGVGAVILGIAFFVFALGFALRPADRSARPLFLASLGYLPALLVLLVVSRAWV